MIQRVNAARRVASPVADRCLRELCCGGAIFGYELADGCPPQPVPILCGGESEAALRRAARLCNGWIGTAYGWDGAVAHVEKLSALRAEPGIDEGADVERHRPSVELFAESVVAKSR